MTESKYRILKSSENGRDVYRPQYSRRSWITKGLIWEDFVERGLYSNIYTVTRRTLEEAREFISIQIKDSKPPEIIPYEPASEVMK